MNQPSDKLVTDRQMLADARSRGTAATLATFTRLSGPGWLQSAITLGGGSLASSLYLGVLAGFSLMWLQPFAMILGIIMLSAIGYVTLSTGERPFRAINQHVNPVLGWGWALAVAAANVVWCLPQYSLANGVLSQNLLPGVLGPGGGVSAWATSSFGAEHWLAQSENASKLIVSVVILILATVITWSYDRGGWGVKLYETILKIVVAIIVLCFFGVVVVLSTSDQPLDWGAILSGFVPDFSKFHRPADTFLPLLDAIGATGDMARDYWQQKIVDEQRDVMISAVATAVGINMTFLFPYSMLRKGWTKEFRGLAIFDLSTGMFIPFVLATGCVVIASASQFHTEIDPGFKIEGNDVAPPDKFFKGYSGAIGKRNDYAASDENTNHNSPMAAEPSLAEKRLAAVLMKRDAMDLAKSLAPLTGNFIANIIFGLGVLAMTLSTISLLMLISGFVFCEILAFPPGGWAHRIGTLIAGVGGALGPFVWGQAAFYLAVPTSVFGFVLLPFAYVTFVFLINQKTLLGDDVPTGLKAFIWNGLMFIAASVATIGSVYMIWKKTGYYGIAAVVGFVLLTVVVDINRRNQARYLSD